MKIKDKLLIGVFLIILVVPMTLMLIAKDKAKNTSENRSLAKLPKFGLYKNFPKLFSEYVSDSFGLRDNLISTNRWLRYKLFGVSPNKAIIIGKENWLYYAPDSNYIDMVNAAPFSETDLIGIKNNLENIQKKFLSMGITFYFLAAPNKQTIYPEYLPNYVTKVWPDSRLDQLTKYLSDFKQIKFINPAEELIAAKHNKSVYLKYDTHWNDYGAFVAYTKLFDNINKDFPLLNPVNNTNVSFLEKTATNRDLAKQMGVSGLFEEMSYFVDFKNSNAKKIFEDCPDKYIGCPLVINEASAAAAYKLVMFRDSFAANLIPLISENFRKSYFYWGAIPYPMSIINKEKPNIVVMELTERELWRLKDKIFTDQ